MWSIQRRKERKDKKQEILLLIQHMALKCDKFTVNFHFLGQTESLGWVLFAHLVGDLLLPFNTYSRMHLKKCNSFPSAVLTADFIALSSTCIFQRKAVACNLSCVPVLSEVSAWVSSLPQDLGNTGILKSSPLLWLLGF